MALDREGLLNPSGGGIATTNTAAFSASYRQERRKSRAITPQFSGLAPRSRYRVMARCLLGHTTHSADVTVA